MDTRAAVCHAVNEPLTMETVQLREPADGEVLIEVRAAGLCHSDMHQMDGSTALYPFPIILGHEGAGIVRAVGPGVRSLEVGDHVVPTAMPECRECANCTSGRTSLCLRFFETRTRESPFTWRGRPVAQFSGVGSFANHTVVREIQVAKIAQDAPDGVACYAGCGVITGLGAALNTAKVRPGSCCVVFGLGGIGLNTVQGARLAGARQIIGVDVNPSREEQGKRFGMTDFVNPKDVNGDVVEFLRNRTGGGADFTFECVGDTTLMEQAFETSRIGYGVTTVVGVAATGKTMQVNPMSLLLGRTIKGELLGGLRTRTQIPEILQWYKDGLVKIDELITHTLPIEQINDGFELMRTGQSMRTVVQF